MDSEELKAMVTWATCLTICVCSLMWGLAWYNSQFYKNNYCERVEMVAQAGAIKVQQKCDAAKER